MKGKWLMMFGAKKDRLEQAKQMKRECKYTCVILGENTVYTSTQRGIRPLLTCYREGRVERGCSAADKVVGKAAAFLYMLLEIRELYADVVSKGALSVLQQAGITVICETVTDAIINRAGTGLCPLETAVMDIQSPLEALKASDKTLVQLSGK